jgi:hypothetical protein
MQQVILVILNKRVSRYENHVVGFKVLTEVLMKSSVIQDVMPCSALKINQCFRGTYGSHLPCQRISQVRNQNEASSRALFATCFMLVSCLTFSSTLNMKVTDSSEISVGFQWTT